MSYYVLNYLFYIYLYFESTKHNKPSLVTTKWAHLHNHRVEYDIGFKNTGFDIRQNYIQILVLVNHAYDLSSQGLVFSAAKWRCVGVLILKMPQFLLQTMECYLTFSFASLGMFICILITFFFSKLLFTHILLSSQNEIGWLNKGQFRCGLIMSSLMDQWAPC